MKFANFSLGVFAALILSGCGGGGGGTAAPSLGSAVPPTIAIPPPNQNLTADKDIVTTGSELILTWVSNNTVSCMASGEWSGAQPTSGKQTLVLTSEGVKTFKLSCASGLENTVQVEVLPQWTTIPDPNFEKALVAMGLDDVVDGRSRTNNLLSVEQLIITTPGFEFDPKPNQGRTFDRLVLTKNYLYSAPSDSLISNLTGIENFRNLRLFYFWRQNTKNFPLRNLKKLRLLGIWQSPMTTFDPTGLEGLEFLGVTESAIQNIDISSLPNLEEIALQQNGTTPYQLPNGIIVSGIQELDTTKNINLKRIYISGNRFKSINLSNNTKLTDLWAGGNYFTNLDVNNNKTLSYLLVSNNRLASLDLRGRGILFRLDTRNNEGLTKIVVDDPDTYKKIRDSCLVSCDKDVTGGAAIWTSPETQFVSIP
jgi:hypothetical protein